MKWNENPCEPWPKPLSNSTISVGQYFMSSLAILLAASISSGLRPPLSVTNVKAIKLYPNFWKSGNIVHSLIIPLLSSFLIIRMTVGWETPGDLANSLFTSSRIFYKLRNKPQLNILHHFIDHIVKPVFYLCKLEPAELQPYTLLLNTSCLSQSQSHIERPTFRQFESIGSTIFLVE